MSIEKQLQDLQGWKEEIALEEQGLMMKAMSSTDPASIIAANKHLKDVETRQDTGLKAWFVDPNNYGQENGYVQKRFGINYNSLRKMARQPIIRAIISTRQTQVSAFSAPQKDKYDTGFEIRKKKSYYDTDKVTYTKAETARRVELTDMMLQCGSGSQKWHGDSFDTFLKKFVEDCLTLDQGTFEVVRDKKGDPAKWMAVDGATFRVADTFDDEMGSTQMNDKKIKGYLPSHVQVIDGSVRSTYYPWELCFGIRNHSTDIRANGYGRSELEDLISIVTYILYSDTYNGKFFSQGSSPKGIFKAKGNINRNRLMEFKQQWSAMMSGVENSWKMPVIEGDMEYIDLQGKNTDMQFTQWQEYLIKVACAVYKISPDECGFDLGGSGGGGITFESNNEQKLMYSRDKGLKPLLKSIEYWINQYIIEPLDDKYEFAFVGIDADTEEKELEMMIKKVENGIGYKEFREELGYDRDLADDDFPLNSAYIQMQSQLAMQEQQQDMEGEDGEGQEDGFDWDQIGQSEENLDETMKAHDNNPMMDDFLKLTVQ